MIVLADTSAIPLSIVHLIRQFQVVETIMCSSITQFWKQVMNALTLVVFMSVDLGHKEATLLGLIHLIR